MPFTIRVDGFAFGETIPRRHTCDGENLSPAIEWTGTPAGTRSLALIVEDPDAPAGAWNHWLLWDIPADPQSLPEAARVGISGLNDFGKPGYGGPCPPRGHGPHRYFFRLFALNTDSLALAAGSRRTALDRALRLHRAVETTYMGRYER